MADDVKLACKAGADVIVMDGMEGGTGASPDSLMDHTGIPTMAALVEAVAALREMELEGVVNLIVSGGIRNGVDAAKALALGADAVSIGTAAMIALGCNKPVYIEDYERMGTEPGACHHCHTGLCPVGITTQDEDLIARLPVHEAADRVEGFLNSMTQEMQMFARACGKNDVHDLEPEDMRAHDDRGVGDHRHPAGGHGLRLPTRSRSPQAVMRAMRLRPQRPLRPSKVHH